MNSIKVCVRVRPFSQRELDLGERSCLAMPSSTQTTVRDKDGVVKEFVFDRAYWSFNPKDCHFASQETLMNELGLELTESALDGYNSCLMAYGQTGSGKTFSILGSESSPAARGMLPRLVDAFFDALEVEKPKDPTMKSTCNVTYIEIYNEHIRDLLQPPHAKPVPLTIHCSATVGVYIQGVIHTNVFCKADVMRLIDFGAKARTVASTSMNATSSRSHCIFTFETKRSSKRVDGTPVQLRSLLNLVDLAGSERQSKTNARGMRLKESGSINKSLSHLALVINKLADIDHRNAVRADRRERQQTPERTCSLNSTGHRQH